MSNIKITELTSLGSHLFEDSESYLTELGYQDVEMIIGGELPYIVSTLLLDLPLEPKVQTKYTVSIGIGLETYTAVLQ